VVCRARRSGSTYYTTDAKRAPRQARSPPCDRRPYSPPPSSSARKKGRELFVPRLPATSTKAELCAVAALERWLAIVGPAGAVFRTFDLRGQLTITRLDSGDVARVLRRRTAMAGVAGDFAGHSLRRGLITNAAKKKIPIENIKRVTGQRSSGIVLDYVAAATLDDDPPLLEIVGLG